MNEGPKRQNEDVSQQNDMHSTKISHEEKNLKECVTSESQKEKQSSIPLEPLHTIEWFNTKGWVNNPFTFNIYPDLLVGYKDQIATVQMLLEEKHKFILLVGPTGSGKTTLLKWIAMHLPYNFCTLYIGKPPRNHEEFVSIFNEKFRPNWFLRLFNLRIKSIYQVPGFLNKKLRKQHLVVLFDEAHESNIDVLEWVRVLADSVNNITFVFSGLQVFENMLADRLETFRKRITAVIPLLSLTKEETRELIRKRIQSVGGTGNEFSKEIIDIIYEQTGGFPREILRACNDLVNNAILQKQEIGKEMLEKIKTEPIKETRKKLSLDILNKMTPMQKEVLELISKKAISPGEIANTLDLKKYKSRQHAVRSVNNILKRLLADGYVERQKTEKTFVYDLTQRMKPLFVKA